MEENIKEDYLLLQAKVLEFYQYLIKKDEYYGVAADIHDKYIKNFGINNERYVF
tara:strand:- start:588 stop:749 length:162 start_codon:yes stop_codon:yes gene_type:complete